MRSRHRRHDAGCPPVAPAPRLVVGPALERLQVAKRVVAEQHDGAPVPTVAPVRPALGHVRLPAEAHATVPAAARLDEDACLVVQHVPEKVAGRVRMTRPAPRSASASAQSAVAPTAAPRAAEATASRSSGEICIQRTPRTAPSSASSELRQSWHPAACMRSHASWAPTSRSCSISATPTARRSCASAGPMLTTSSSRSAMRQMIRVSARKRPLPTPPRALRARPRLGRCSRPGARERRCADHGTDRREAGADQEGTLEAVGQRHLARDRAGDVGGALCRDRRQQRQADRATDLAEGVDQPESQPGLRVRGFRWSPQSSPRQTRSRGRRR